MAHKQKKLLKVVQSPATGHVMSAPPTLIASTHTIDFCCGRCGAILLHAEEDQVHGLLIRCTDCGSYNATD
jgi:DNA-directed RNA polymerase subunit RPC12/RpoP